VNLYQEVRQEECRGSLSNQPSRRKRSESHIDVDVLRLLDGLLEEEEEEEEEEEKEEKEQDKEEKSVHKEDPNKFFKRK